MNLGEVLLIEYDIFFEELSGVCFFSIDDNQELKELQNLLNQIKSYDNNASFYCCTYGLDRYNDKLYIYCDNIWINTKLPVDVLRSLFYKFDTVNNPLRGIVPLEINILTDKSDMKINYVICNDGTICNYQEKFKKMEINRMKSILWE